MTTDSSSKEPAAPRPDWRMPELIDVRIALVPYEPPKLRYFKSATAEYRQAVEFLAEIKGELPGRAKALVLYVGDVPVFGGEFAEDNVLRFLAFEPEQLRAGAPITLGWDGEYPPPDRDSKFRYEPPKGEKRD